MPSPLKVKTIIRPQYNNTFWRNTLYLLFFLLFPNCQSPSPFPNKTIRPAFYHWTSTFRLNDFERQSLRAIDTERLYTKFFDVQPHPDRPAQIVAPTRIRWADFPDSLELCPVVYLTNTTFAELDTAEMEPLVDYLFGEIDRIAAGHPFSEIQLDCDWSGKTREKYFAFLRAFKARRPELQLSCTIRLHQIKYRQKTGIPPVDRGMLMIYNLEPPVRMTELNTIFDPEEIGKYLQGQPPYALPLDLALPVYSWGIHFQDGQFKGVLRNFNRAKLAASDAFAKKQGLFYTVQKDIVLQNEFLRKGNLLKLEEVDLKAIPQVLAWAMPLLPNDTVYLTLFHLDEEPLKYYQNEKLQDIYQSFR